jgi:outer membrane scaffolding protein for murein synthesis (MipA/OmpV family)
VYVGGSLLTWQQWFIPSVKAFGGLSDSDGVYLLFDVVAPIQISDVFALSVGGSAGWGSTSYNDQYWGEDGISQDAGWNDFNVYCGAEYKILDNLALQASLTYTMVDGGSIEEGANENYENDHKFWGDLNLVYTF